MCSQAVRGRAAGGLRLAAVGLFELIANAIEVSLNSNVLDWFRTISSFEQDQEN